MMEGAEKVGKAVAGVADEVAPKVDEDVVGKAVLEAMEGKGISASARNSFKESALKNPMFQFETNYKQTATAGQQAVDILDMTKNKTMESAVDYKPDEDALMRIKDLTAQKKNLFSEMSKTDDDNAVIAFQKQVDDIGYEIRDLKKGNIQFPEDVVKDLKAQASYLNIQPDVIDAHLKAHKFGDIKKMFKSAAKEKSYINCAQAMRELCTDRRIPKAQIDEVFKDATTSWANKGARLRQMAEEADKILQDALEQSGKKIDIAGIGKYEKFFTGVESKIGDGRRYFYQKGAILAGQAMEKLSGVARVGGVAKTKLKNLTKQGQLRLLALGENKKKAVIEYIEKRNYGGAKMFSDHPTKPMIMANLEMAEAVGQKYGVKIGYNEMKFANQMSSMLREDLKYRTLWKAGQYDQATRELPRSINELDGTVIKHANTKFDRDLGTNYWPRIANDEWLAKNGKRFAEDISSYNNAVRDNDYGNQMKFFERRRMDAPELQIYENRIPAEEELQRYLSGSSDATIRREGIRLINEAKFATMMPLKETGSRNLKGEHQYLKVIEDNWRTNFDPKGIEGLNKAEKLLLSYSRAVIPLALMSEKMIMSNTFQNIFTGGYRHGYLRAIAGAGLELTKFGAEVIFHPFRLRSVFDSMAKGDFDKAVLMGDKGIRARNLYRYQQNNTGLHTMIDEDFKSIIQFSGENAEGVMSRAFAWLGETLSLPFSCSDQISRRAAFTTAHWHGESALKTLEKNMRKGMSYNDAEAIMIKDLHLHSFNLGDDPNYILKAIDPDNIKGSTEEFLFRYADRSMRQEIFDYSTMGQNMAKAKMKQWNPIAGVAMTFTSWPMYFHELSKGALKAYKNGDKAPLQKLVMGGIAVYMGTAYAMREDSPFQKNLQPYMDGGGVKGYLAKTASEMPSYLQARSPGLSYQMFVEKLTSSPAGIFTPVVGVVTYPIVSAMDDFSDMISGGERNHMEFAKKAAEKYGRNEIAWRRGLYLSKVFKQVGILDKDLSEMLEEVSE